MGPSSRSTHNAGSLPPNASPAPLTYEQSNRSNSNNNGSHVPQLDLAHAAEVAASHQGSPWVQGPLASAMDTTRSQQCANCSDCMLPCKVFLGLSAPKAPKLPAPNLTDPKQTCVPVRAPGQQASVGAKSSRTVSSDRIPGRAASSMQTQPGFIHPVPLVLSSTAVACLQERGRTLDSQRASAGAAQVSSSMQAQQSRPSSQYPLVRAAVVPLNRPIIAPVYRGQLQTPVITTAQSVSGVVPSGQFPAYIVPAPSSGAFAETQAGGAAGAGAAAAAQAAAPYATFAAQNSHLPVAIFFECIAICMLNSSNQRELGFTRSLDVHLCAAGWREDAMPSGCKWRTSVAPPLPRVHAAAASNPVAAYDETGMKSGRVSERRNVENVTEDQQPIELDPSLRDVLDGQMLSSRSRLLAMELKEPDSGDVSVKDRSEMIPGITNLRTGVNTGREPSNLEDKDGSDSQKAVAVRSFDKPKPLETEDQASGRNALVQGDQHVPGFSLPFGAAPHEQAGRPHDESQLRKPAIEGLKGAAAEVADSFAETSPSTWTQFESTTALESSARGRDIKIDRKPLQQQHTWTTLTGSKSPTASDANSPPTPENTTGTPIIGLAPRVRDAYVDDALEKPASHNGDPSVIPLLDVQQSRSKELIFSESKRATEQFSKELPGMLPNKAVEGAPKAESGARAKAAEPSTGEKAVVRRQLWVWMGRAVVGVEGKSEGDVKDAKAAGPKAGPALLPKKSMGVLPKKALPVAAKTESGAVAKGAEGEAGEKAVVGVDGKSEGEVKDGKAAGPKAGPAVLPKKAAAVLPKKAVEGAPKAESGAGAKGAEGEAGEKAVVGVDGKSAKAAEGEAGEKAVVGVDVKSEGEVKDAKAAGPKAGPAVLPKKAAAVLPKKAVEGAPKAESGAVAKGAEGEAGEKAVVSVDVKSEGEVKDGKAAGPKAG
ncbi:hypothetical protein, conserved, partial [Eimeria maxima]